MQVENFPTTYTTPGGQVLEPLLYDGTNPCVYYSSTNTIRAYFRGSDGGQAYTYADYTLFPDSGRFVLTSSSTTTSSSQCAGRRYLHAEDFRYKPEYSEVLFPALSIIFCSLIGLFAYFLILHPWWRKRV